MTGNTKVWRAPLAGLASFAMIATMGLAAGTANADAKPADFTFNVPSGSAKFDKDKAAAEADVTYKSETQITVKDSDGKLDKATVTKAQNVVELSDADYVLTGWFAGSDAGDAVATTTGVDSDFTGTALTAHVYNKADVYTVDFDGANDVTFSGSDKVATWQVPTDADPNDGKLLKGWKSAAQDGANVDFTKDDLTQLANKGSKNIPLTADSVASTTVTFDAQGWTLPTDFKTTVEVELGAAYGKDLPTVTKAGKSTNEWIRSDTKDYTSRFTKDTVVNEALTIRPVTTAASTYSTVSFDASYADTDAPKAQTVIAGSAATKPSDPTKKDGDNLKYKFAGWYTGDQFNVADDPSSGVKSGAKAFDFSTKVYKDTTLYAAFEVTSVRVQFDPAYGTEPKQEKWFSTGDTFVSPTIVKDGKVATFVDANGNVVDGKKLTVEGERLSYLVSENTNAGEEAKPKYITAGYVFKATYDTASDDTLTNLENNVDLTASASDQDLTEGSFAQYKKDFEDYLADKAAKGANGYTVSEYAELIKELKALQAKLVEVGDTNLYRLYNRGNGDHFYTANQSEAASLTALGWKFEGTPYRVLNATSKKSGKNLGTAIYSVYNPNTGEHLLTTSDYEAKSLAKAGWNNEGVKFYAPQGANKGVYRVYNPNTNGPAHHYAGQSEANGLVKLGWRSDFNGNAVFYLD